MGLVFDMQKLRCEEYTNRKKNATDWESRFMSTGVVTISNPRRYEYIEVVTDEKFRALSPNTKEAFEEFKEFKKNCEKQMGSLENK